ncbi:hypothetical protein LCGC14_2389550 [marine sediment metagenome]|uniref:Uncharacterized protein n=1 Tax=marine sediment metagenome TaxID=412755 RepID=A0A0F9BYJ2_9ZZZZ
MSKLTDDLLIKRYHYFKDSVKAPMMKSIKFISRGKFGYVSAIWHAFQIIRLLKKYPEPTRANCENPDALVMLDIWDEFFKWEDNKYRDPFFKLVRRITVSTVEHCDFDSQRITWWLMKLTQAYMDGRWQPLLPHMPFYCWTDPEVIKAREEAVEDMICTMAEKMGVV